MQGVKGATTTGNTSLKLGNLLGILIGTIVQAEGRFMTSFIFIGIFYFAMILYFDFNFLYVLLIFFSINYFILNKDCLFVESFLGQLKKLKSILKINKSRNINQIDSFYAIITFTYNFKEIEVYHGSS